MPRLNAGCAALLPLFFPYGFTCAPTPAPAKQRSPRLHAIKVILARAQLQMGLVRARTRARDDCVACAVAVIAPPRRRRLHASRRFSCCFLQETPVEPASVSSGDEDDSSSGVSHPAVSAQAIADAGKESIATDQARAPRRP
eukprot:3192143-Pleurochrysis_carterae.AAC.1